MTFIIVIAVVLLIVAFLSSLVEAVILSVTPAYVAVSAEEGQRSAVLLEHLIEKIDRPLSAILTMNTIVNTMGSAAIAYLVQHEFGDVAVSISSVILTVLILFGAEILPKSIGANHWKQLAPFSAYYAQALIIMLYPFVFLSDKMSHRIRAKAEEEPEVSREEVIMTAEIGAEEGSIKLKESNIIKNLLMLDKIFVSDIMTPRSVLFALEGHLSVEEVTDRYKPLRFSRVPVYNNSLDNIIGVTHRYRILEALNDAPEKKIQDIIDPIASVQESMTVSHALDFFIKEKEHLALALDEYGVVTGLVTLEDAVETLLGVEIVDEFDQIEDMRKYALEQWQMRKQKLRRT